MRAPLLATLLLLPFAATAQAHEGHALGLELSDIQMVFDPATASTVFSFHLKNNDTGKTGGLFATITLVDDTLPMNGIGVIGPDGKRGSLLAAEEGDFTASLQRVIVRGCIFVQGTASGEWAKQSNFECVQTSGLSAAPTEIPVPLPAVTEIPDALPLPGN